MLIVLGIVLAIFAGFSAIKNRWGIAAAIAALVILCLISSAIEG